MRGAAKVDGLRNDVFSKVLLKTAAFTKGGNDLLEPHGIVRRISDCKTAEVA
jgi:hypothetical protein